MHKKVHNARELLKPLKNIDINFFGNVQEKISTKNF